MRNPNLDLSVRWTVCVLVFIFFIFLIAAGFNNENSSYMHLKNESQKDYGVHILDSSDIVVKIVSLRRHKYLVLNIYFGTTYLIRVFILHFGQSIIKYISQCYNNDI